MALWHSCSPAKGKTEPLPTHFDAVSHEFPMKPMLIGYFAKRIVPKPAWIDTPGVIEISSVSTCISKGPQDWIDRWTHNEMWLYASEALARAAIAPPERSGDFDIYAYVLLPVIFDARGNRMEYAALTAAERQALEAAARAADPVPGDYERLGIDVAGQDLPFGISGFACSPLSCNALATEMKANIHCLIDTLEDATKAAALIAADQPEPSRYHLVEVWRKRRDALHS